MKKKNERLILHIIYVYSYETTQVLIRDRKTKSHSFICGCG